jgi:hypothetical protein
MKSCTLYVSSQYLQSCLQRVYGQKDSDWLSITRVFVWPTSEITIFLIKHIYNNTLKCDDSYTEYATAKLGHVIGTNVKVVWF